MSVFSIYFQSKVLYFLVNVSLFISYLLIYVYSHKIKLLTPSLVLLLLALRLRISTFINVSLFIQGATIRRDEATGAVIVARIMRGGAADRSGENKQHWHCW